MISLRTPIRQLPDSQVQSRDSPRAAREIVAEESDHRDGDQEERREKRSIRAWKEDDLITYKRRPRVRSKIDKAVERDKLCNSERKRKNLDDGVLESPENNNDGETGTPDPIDQPAHNWTKVCGRASIEATGSGRRETLPTIKAWKNVIGIQKTVAPRRVIGQYFLDLGQSDFSHTTCPTCGLFYARGHENDEKVHKTFHRNLTQGIIFKGWQTERVASRLDDKGNRVIVVLSEDTHHQAKVREVIDVMELELGLTPGWLMQRPCKVYLFISSSKKIVGCLMAEPIKSAFRVVSTQCQSLSKDGKQTQSDGNEKKSLIMKSGLQSAVKESSSQLDRSASEFPATQSDDVDKCEQGAIKEENHLLPPSNPAASTQDVISSVCVSKSVALGQSPDCLAKVKGDLSHPSVGVKQESGFVRDRMKNPKITDFFTVKTTTAGSPAFSKSERDVVDSRAAFKGTYVKAEKDEESSHNCFVSGQDHPANYRQPYHKEEVLHRFAAEVAEDKGSPLASGSRETDLQDERTREGRHHRDNVLVFGNVKFLREMPSRKRASKERTQDLGRAILCTKIPVPAVCGIRVIWVSHTERRKGIASHLLDAMRKTFSLGVVLEPSQFAFSQPTPEGRKFAGWYCKTDEFLVYTTS